MFDGVRDIDGFLRRFDDVGLHGVERSFKVRRGAVLWDRMLVGIDKASIAPTADLKLLNICDRMGMPPGLREAFRPELAEVNFVLFGFEADGETVVHKAYLEYYDQFPSRTRDQADKTSPYLMHLGYKWDVDDPSRTARTRYTWLPMLSGSAILNRIEAIYATAERPEGFEAVEKIFRAAAGRLNRSQLIYLDVTEVGQPRRSFDVNLYAAGLRLSEIGEMLDLTARRFDVADETVLRRLAEIDEAVLGHLAGGVDRHEREFMTVYYELVDAAGLPSANITATHRR